MSINVQKRLIEKGYFPDEMGFWFSAKSFANKISVIESQVSYDKRKISKCYRFSTPKGQINRREISLPNPYHYFFLTQEIAGKWNEIEAQYDKSDISLTRPVFRNGSDRAIVRKYSFEDITSIFLSKSVGARYVLKTDISRYYESIYTHSIPWALHTKPVAKANRKNTLTGNVLDRLSRNLQDGQTKGIPTGQDASLIISEIIGSAMDELIMQDVNCINAFRYVDDYYLFFDSRDEAQKALSKVREILREFELQINEEKTGIHEMPKALEPEWISMINSLNIDEDHLISFVNNVYSIMNNYPDDEVLRYAFSRLKRIKIKKNQWTVVEAFLLNSFIYDATAAPLACSILSEFYHRKYGISKNKVLRIVETLINKMKTQDCEYELLWALWLCKLLKVKLTDELLGKMKDITNPLIILVLLFDYRNNSNLDKTNWIEYMVEDELYGSNWILAYEALKRGWLPSKNGVNYLQNDDFFKVLSDNNVTFFNTNCRDEWIYGHIEEKWLPMFSPAF